MSQTGVDMQELLEQLRATVAERRVSGQYPEGLEDGLDAHFERIVATRPGLPMIALLRRRVETARRAARFSPARIPASSNLPGGRYLHKSLAKVFFRQAQGILLQVQEFADRTIEALDAMVSVVESPDTHRHDQLVEVLDAHSELLAGRDRVPTAPLDQLSDLRARLERLEAGAAAQAWKPWFSRARFEAAFGDGSQTRAEQLAADGLAGGGPVLDLAGEEEADPLVRLADPDTAGLAAVVLLSAEDRVSAAGLIDLIALAADKLAAGGRLVVSCGSSQPDGVGAVTRPRFNPSLGPILPADYAAFACREAGFSSVEVEVWPDSGYLIVARR